MSTEIKKEKNKKDTNIPEGIIKGKSSRKESVI